MTQHSTRKALVIGAGIGGLAAAATLRRAGVEVQIFERAPELRPGTTAVSLMSNAVLALRTQGIDIAPGLDKRGEVFDELKFLTKRGRLIRALPFRELADRLGASNHAVHRADLQQTLLDALGDDQVIEVNAAATGFVTGDDGVEVTFEDGRKASGDVLIGADGFNSAIRRQVAGAEEPRSGNYVCWLATVPFSHPRLTKGYAAHYWGRGQRFGLADIGHGRAYWWGTKNVPDWVSGTPRLGKEKIAGVFAGWADEVQEAIRVTPEETIVTITAQDRPFLQRWGTGRTTLLGDAAHPMLVSLGQGAALAIEDAVVLAEHLKDATDLPAALRGYEDERRPRTEALVAAARALSENEQLDGPFSSRMRDLYFRFAPMSKFTSQNEAVLTWPPLG
ncbi:FAD-dependent monooxygenase [Streptomyces sp. NBC_00250]|uniref:FAD-dependent monooxygenase n=1 Tax=unclassified Streptomyces TaxID=2593676 RepID=UPI00224E90FB|nr:MULTISPECIES: FAD-dependent monooxygenase [unclassified Streptomyces]MCX4985367.1 FAD-dependent monooxygenase [Streptomyces sp. NBC_00572]